MESYKKNNYLFFYVLFGLVEFFAKYFKFKSETVGLSNLLFFGIFFKTSKSKISARISRYYVQKTHLKFFTKIGQL